MIKFKNMCDKCFRILGDGEPMYGFVLIDDDNEKRLFKGHEQCVQEMADMINQLYGKVDNDEGKGN